jgi:hypothetical protein
LEHIESTIKHKQDASKCKQNGAVVQKCVLVAEIIVQDSPVDRSNEGSCRHNNNVQGDNLVVQNLIGSFVIPFDNSMLVLNSKNDFLESRHKEKDLENWDQHLTNQKDLPGVRDVQEVSSTHKDEYQAVTEDRNKGA